MFNTSKQSFLSFSILIAVSLITGWFLVWKIHETKETLNDSIFVSDQITKNLVQNIGTVDTSNWKTYRNEEFRFEMKYPENWEINNPEFTIDPIGTIFTKSKNNSFFVISQKTFINFNDYINKDEPIASLKVIKQNELNELKIKDILGLKDGIFPDGFTVSYKISELNNVHSNFVKRGYEYEYLVYEKSTSQKTSELMRKFKGFVWKIDDKVYVLQDQTQISNWNENTLNKSFISSEKLFSIFTNFKTW